MTYLGVRMHPTHPLPTGLQGAAPMSTSVPADQYVRSTSRLQHYCSIVTTAL